MGAMSKRSNKPISQGTQASTTRTPWLGLALVVLAAVAVISIVVWMAQQSTANALTATTPALSAVATNATDAAPAPATATSFTAADGVTALPADGPRIAVEQTLFDYGDVRFNTPIETVVRVSNVGSEVLAIAQNPRVELVEGC